MTWMSREVTPQGKMLFTGACRVIPRYCIIDFLQADMCVVSPIKNPTIGISTKIGKSKVKIYEFTAYRGGSVCLRKHRF